MYYVSSARDMGIMLMFALQRIWLKVVLKMACKVDRINLLVAWSNYYRRLAVLEISECH
jgi:hypothetical protein